VVDATLALAEPYRSVVLLRYWQGLAPAQIGAQLGRSAATVRSQLSRGHALLRARLDDPGAAGDRWALLALPASGASTSLFTVACAACAALTVPFALWLARRPAFDPSPGDAALAAAHGAPARDQDEAPRSRAPQAPARRPGDAQLERMEPAALLALVVQARRALEEMLFSPRLEDLQPHALLVERSDVRMTRLLDRRVAEDVYAGYFNSDAAGAYGAYFSFATRSHDFNAEPDLALDGELRPSASPGFLHDLGELALTDVPQVADEVPRAWSNERRAMWAFLREDYSSDQLTDGTVLRRGEELCARSAPVVVGHTYLLRSADRRRHDQLVAFQVIGRGDDGVTLAWRVLASWMGPQRERRDPYADVPAPPGWLAALGHDDLLQLMSDVKTHGERKLFSIGSALARTETARAYLALAGPADRAGLTKLLPRGKWNPLVWARLGGAYWSCARRSHSYNDSPDLALQGTGHYGSGFAGSDEGWFLDLGALTPEDLTLALRGDAPDSLTPEQVAAWDLLLGTQPTVEGRRRSVDSETRRLAAEVGLAHHVAAHIGHTYLLRTLLYADHDDVIVFTTLDAGDEGHTLAWRLLEQR
jgi:hypothetical protein